MGTVQKRKVIGLLGGSFNPPHEGHLYISRQAKDKLGLEEVWWLVCPQNPLKSARELAPLEQRFRLSQKMAAHDGFITVSDYEKKFETVETIKTLKMLIKEYPESQFIWLMGADHLPHFHQWKKWHEIVELVPIAVIARGDALQELEASCLHQSYHADRIKEPSQLKWKKAPAWCVLDIPTHPASSTEIRRQNNLK